MIMSIVHRLDFFGSEIPYNCFNERVSSLSFTAKLRLRLKKHGSIECNESIQKSNTIS